MEPNTKRVIQAVCFDWGGTLMSEDGPADIPMGQWEHVRCLPGALEAVQALHKGYLLCLATNATVSRQPMIERALERVGLLDYFSHIFCFTELGLRKESLDFWLAVAKELDIQPSNLAMVGDSLEADVLAPRALGVLCAWLRPSAGLTEIALGVPIVSNLGEFVCFVEKATGNLTVP